MNRKEIKRQGIFTIYKNALNTISVDNVDFVICPLCLNKFSNIEEFSLEHVPPDSQGGKDILITCKKCNSEAGRTIDSDLYRQDMSENLYSKIRKSNKIQISIFDVDINSSIMKNKGNKFDLRVAPRNNCLSNFGKFENIIKNSDLNQRPLKCKFKIKNKYDYNPFRASVSYLKSAYLIAFTQFGYRYIFREQIETVREQILNYETRIIDKFCASSNDRNDFTNSIVLIDEPLKALVIKFKTKYIFLPFLESVENFYEYISNCISDDIYLSGKFLPFPQKPEFIFDFLKYTKA